MFLLIKKTLCLEKLSKVFITVAHTVKNNKNGYLIGIIIAQCDNRDKMALYIKTGSSIFYLKITRCASKWK